MRLAVVFLLLVINGCCLFNNGASDIDIRYPIIQVPDRPILYIITYDDLRPLRDDVIRKLIANDNKLKTYIEKLEAAINEYNRWANEHNR